MWGKCQMLKFPDKLRLVRERRGISQRQLSKRLGTSKSYINNLENGEGKPSIDLIVKIAHFLDVSIDVLLKDELDLDGDA
jgi:transcriptional regulator with XRE-family HTH domain